MLESLSFYGSRIEERNLGEGSFGYVYKIGKENGEEYAVKVFKHLDQNGLSTDTLREIAILSKVDHPNIVNLIGIADFSTYSQGPISIILELGAMSLNHYMNLPNTYRNRANSEPLFKSYMYQLLRGLIYLHDNDIWHRDIKPQNMLVFPTGRIVISDFGIARSSAIPGSSYTGKIQTLWYRAPEILLGAISYGPEVDIFSLGVTFADLWKGGNPIFAYDTATNVLLKQISLLGHFNEQDWPGISGMQGYTVALRKYAESRIEGKWERQFAGINLPDELKRIFIEMTYPNPSRRASLESILLSPFFDNVRDVVERELEANLVTETICGQVLDDKVIYIDPANLKINSNLDMKADYYHKIFQYFSELKDHFRLDFPTYYHCRLLFDMFIEERIKINSKDLIIMNMKTLQLVATGCLLISIKLLEKYSTPVDSLVGVGDGGYSKKNLLDMELNIAKILKFNFVFPLPSEYIYRYVLGFDPEHKYLVNKLVELYCTTYNPIDSKKVAQNATAVVVKCINRPLPACLKDEFDLQPDHFIDEIRKIKPYIQPQLNLNEDLRRIVEEWPNCQLKEMEIEEEKEHEHQEDQEETELHYFMNLFLTKESNFQKVSRQELGIFAKEILMNYLINEYTINNNISLNFAKYFNLEKGSNNRYIPPVNLPEKIKVLIGMFKDHHVEIFLVFDQFPTSEVNELNSLIDGVTSEKYKIHNRNIEGYLANND